MPKDKRSFMEGVAIRLRKMNLCGAAMLFLLFLVGCDSKPADSGDASDPSALNDNSVAGVEAPVHSAVANNHAPRSRVAIPYVYEGLAPAYPPAVFLSNQHSALCLVQSGDRFPDFSLPDLNEEMRPFSSLLGKVASVVVVWNADYYFAQKQFEQLPRDLGEFYNDPNISVITIAVGEDPNQIRALASENRIDCTMLIDSDSELYNKIASERLPLSYVLNAKGEVVWHDLEYSRTSRRELLNALRFVLSNPSF